MEKLRKKFEIITGFKGHFFKLLLLRMFDLDCTLLQI